MIGVIGAGTIGRSVALNFAAFGHRVVLVDRQPSVLTNLTEQLRSDINLLHMMKRLPVGRVEAMDNLTLTSDYELLKNVDYIVENITEVWDMKRELYASVLAPLNGRGIALGVNTSCTSITRLANLLPNPELVIGTHFMNPAPLNDFIELVRGAKTSDEAVSCTIELIKGLNKKFVLVEDSVGFISNRISHIFMNESARLVYEGIATPSQIDAVFKYGYGHKMGPLETADLIGIDTVVDSLEVLYEHYMDTKYSVCPLLKKLVYQGDLGKKVGKGFYVYD